MQHNLAYWSGGIPNMFTPQYTPYNPVPASPYLPTIPEVSGEGDLVSIMYPDGNLQFFFVPTSVQWAGNINFTNPNLAWRVKTISNPIPAAVFSQNYPQLQGNSQCIPMEQNKFHNDGCSSTTDLHYFYPSPAPLYPNVAIGPWLPKVDTSVQMTSQCGAAETQYPGGCCVNVTPDYRRYLPNAENMVVDEQTYETKHRRSIMCPVKREKKCRSKGVYFRSETSFSSETHATSGSETERPEPTDKATCVKKHRKIYADKLAVKCVDRMCGNDGSKSTNTSQTAYFNNCISVETQSLDSSPDGSKDYKEDVVSKELFAESLMKERLDGNTCSLLRCPPSRLRIPSLLSPRNETAV